MKKYISIALLITFLFNLGGSWFVFLLVHKKIRAEVHTYMRNLSKHELLIYDLDELKKMPPSRVYFEHEDEFILDGVLYDIISIENTEKNTVYVFKDEREASFLKVVLGEKMTDLKDFCASLFHLLIQEAYLNCTDFIFSNPSKLFIDYFSRVLFREIKTALMFAFIGVLTPLPNN